MAGGGAGSMAHMNKSLKDNSNLLGKRKSYFKQKRGASKFVKRRHEPAPEKVILKIKKEAKITRRNNIIKSVITLIIVFGIVFFLIYLLPRILKLI